MSKKMMILGASALQVPAIKKAHELGYETIVVDYNPQAIGFELADVKLVVSTIDKEAVLEKALEYKPDVVLTSTSDAPVRTAAYVNEKLGLRPDLSFEDSKCATIKSFMRNRLSEKGVPCPKYYCTKNYEGFEKAVKELDYHAIVKPSDNAGSRGVTLVTKDDVDRLNEIYDYVSGNNRQSAQVMVEEFMEGPEISVESMTVDGETTVVTITDKITTKPPYFVELGHVEPSRLPDDIKEKVIQITKDACKAIGMVNCPSHTEMKITSEGPKIVEIAARLGGDYITSRLVPLSTGVDIVGESIVLACGQKPDLNKKFDKGSAICFIGAEEGTVKEIVVPQSIETADNIYEVCIEKRPGDVLEGTKSSDCRIGYVIATGEDGDSAYESAKEAASRIKVVYER